VVQNDSVAAAPSRSLNHILGVVWLVFFFSDVYLPLDQISPIPIFYPIVGSGLLYFALARPLQVMSFVSQPIVWLWALTAIIPLAMNLFGGESNPFAWSAAVVRVTYFAAFAGAGVFLLGPEGPGIIRTSARIALFIAIATNLADLAWDNPYNSAEGSGRTAGFYGDANRAAAAIGTLLLLSVDITKQSLKGLLVAGLSMLAIVATQSRSGMVFGAFLSAAYVFLPTGRRTFSVPARLGLAVGGVFFVVVLVVTAFQVLDLDPDQTWRIRSIISLDTSDGSSQDRLEAAGTAIESSLENLWTGLGPGGARYYGHFSHNAYLQTGLEYGIGGLLLYLALVFYPFLKTFRFGFRRTLTLSLIAFQFIFYGFFSHSVQNSSIFGVFFGAVIVNALVQDRDQGDESTDSN
jgi:O-antigen ligase